MLKLVKDGSKQEPIADDAMVRLQAMQLMWGFYMAAGAMDALVETNPAAFEGYGGDFLKLAAMMMDIRKKI